MERTNLTDSINTSLLTTRMNELYGDDIKYKEFLNYLAPIHKKNINSSVGVCEYAHGATVAAVGYAGGVYSPTQNRIYFVPCAQVGESTWHYIDCNTGDVIAYSHNVTAAGTYMGGIFSPVKNKTYFIPYGQAPETTWHYIQDYSKSEVSPSIMASTLFNKF